MIFIRRLLPEPFSPARTTSCPSSILNDITADLIAALCKEYDNAVLVGTNTGGEGVSGYAVNCILPESHFGFVYVPTVNEKYPEDSFNGIQPDVYSARTMEEYLYIKSVEKQDKDYDSYENRQKWDGTLKKVLSIVDGK